MQCFYTFLLAYRPTEAFRLLTEPHTVLKGLFYAKNENNFLQLCTKTPTDKGVCCVCNAVSEA